MCDQCNSGEQTVPNPKEKTLDERISEMKTQGKKQGIANVLKSVLGNGPTNRGFITIDLVQQALAALDFAILTTASEPGALEALMGCINQDIKEWKSLSEHKICLIIGDAQNEATPEKIPAFKRTARQEKKRAKRAAKVAKRR